MTDFAAIILAAGKGTRMNSDRAKVLHRAAGRSLLEWALSAVGDAKEITVVVGHQADQVATALPVGVRSVVQEPQNGTGHATQVGLAGAAVGADAQILVLPGDMPLIRRETVESLVAEHTSSGSAATVLTAVVDDPFGYGRVLRDGDLVTAIVEERDADDTQRAIHEVNTSVYLFDGGLLDDALRLIGSDNDQGELYLTDVIAVLNRQGHRVGAHRVEAGEAVGVNSHEQLAAAGELLRRRINAALMASGVEMVDPSRAYVDADVVVEPGATLYPDVHIEGASHIGRDAVVGPGVMITDSVIGAGTAVSYSVLDRVVVGADASIGPYAHLRPGSELGDGTKAGSFVEIKATTVGPGSNVPHLAYVGDAVIGEGSNIGAGTVTVNYDGYAKHRTIIGNRVRIGSDTMLVAPVEIGDDAYTGAGSVITKNVSPGALAVERSPQRELKGYAARRRRKAEREQT